MEISYKEHWDKRNEGEWKPTSKQEYEKAVLPQLQEYLDNPTKRGNYNLLEEAVDLNVTSMDLFLASEEELVEMKKKIMADYRDKCIDEIEYETGYRHWLETIIE